MFPQENPLTSIYFFNLLPLEDFFSDVDSRNLGLQGSFRLALGRYPWGRLDSILPVLGIIHKLPGKCLKTIFLTYFLPGTAVRLSLSHETKGIYAAHQFKDQYSRGSQIVLELAMHHFYISLCESNNKIRLITKTQNKANQPIQSPKPLWRWPELRSQDGTALRNTPLVTR